MEGVRREREACGPSKFSIHRTSRDKLQLDTVSLIKQLFQENNLLKNIETSKNVSDKPMQAFGHIIMQHSDL